MSGNLKNTFKAIWILILGFALLDAPEAQAAKPAVMHRPPLIEQLPDPGEELVLHAALQGTRETGYLVYALISRDGKQERVAAHKSYLDARDTPTYEMVTSSPLVNISYSFVVKYPDGSFQTTREYTITRNCQPRINVDGLSFEASETPTVRFNVLAQKSEALAKRLKSYEAITAMLEELKGELISEE